MPQAATIKSLPRAFRMMKARQRRREEGIRTLRRRHRSVTPMTGEIWVLSDSI